MSNLFTTQLLTRPLPPTRRRFDPLAIVALSLIIVGVLALIIVAARARASTPAQPTVAPIIILASPTAAAIAPTPAAAIAAPAHGLPRAIVAYDQPNGAVLGPIEAGRAFTTTARYGVDWIQLDVAGSGEIWTDAALAGLTIDGLADLEPPPTAIVVYVPMSVPAGIPEAVDQAADALADYADGPGCWAGPPAPYQPGQERCWAGPPFVEPTPIDLPAWRIQVPVADGSRCWRTGGGGMCRIEQP